MSKAGQSVAFFVRCGYPNASDSIVEHVLWGRTAFPFDPKLTAKHVYKAAYSLYRADKKGIILCDFCHRIAVVGCLCERCDNAMYQRISKDIENKQMIKSNIKK